MVEDRTAYGALLLPRTGPAILLVANGGGHAVATMLMQLGQQAAGARGTTLITVDLAPTSPNDPNADLVIGSPNSGRGKCGHTAGNQKTAAIGRKGHESPGDKVPTSLPADRGDCITDAGVPGGVSWIEHGVPFYSLFRC